MIRSVMILVWIGLVFNTIYLTYQVNVQRQEIQSIKSVMVRARAMQPDNDLRRDVTKSMDEMKKLTPDGFNPPMHWPARRTQ